MFVFLLYVFCGFVLFYVLFLILCCLFPIFVQDYRPLPSGGDPTAVNKYIISYRAIYEEEPLRWECREHTFLYNHYPDTESSLRRYDQINSILFLNFLG